MKKVSKLFFVWQSNKEKEWLESMALQGYILDKVTFFKYVFREEESKDMVYQFDFQILNKKSEPDYLELFKDWTLVSKFGSWYYFSKIREGNNKDEIYSDENSKSEMFKRVLVFLLIVGFPLYYQSIIMFPNMESSRLEFPSFYYFFRIIVYIVLALHTYALINVFLIYRTYRKALKE